MNGVWSSETSFRDRRFRSSVLVFGIAVAYPSEHSFAQTADDHAMLAKHAVLTKLSTPICPPLARQARTNGEIDLALDICPDGTVGSVSDQGPSHAEIGCGGKRSTISVRVFSLHWCRNFISIRFTFELLPLDHNKDCAILNG